MQKLSRIGSRIKITGRYSGNQEIHPPDFGQILGFSNGKVDNSTLIQWFCAKLGPWMLKFRGAGPYRSQIIWGGTEMGFSKNVKLVPSSGFGRHMQEIETKSAKIESNLV